MVKYFVCYAYRQMITTDYAQEFYDECEYKKLYYTYKEAYNEMDNSCYDDSDYTVCSVYEGKVKIERH